MEQLKDVLILTPLKANLIVQNLHMQKPLLFLVANTDWHGMSASFAVWASCDKQQPQQR